MNKNDYALARRIYRFKTISKYMRKAKLLGYQDLKVVISFLNVRLLISLLLFGYFFIFFDLNYIVALLIMLIFYYGFSYYMFDYRIKKRAKNLEKDAIYFFEVLALSLEAGKSLIQGLRLTVSSVDSELSNEFANIIREIDYGKSFHDALTDLRLRMPSDIIQNVILNITEAYISGGDITSTLRKQVDYIQNKRVMDIKAVINQIPIKISVVSVFLFIPLVLLLILAPVILEYFVG